MDHIFADGTASIRRLIFALAACASVAVPAIARAQSIEPRSYSNAPVGVNFFIAGYAYADHGLSLDPSLPITDVKLHPGPQNMPVSPSNASSMASMTQHSGYRGISMARLHCRWRSLPTTTRI